MKKYEVHISETHTSRYTVEAENEDAATLAALSGKGAATEPPQLSTTVDVREFMPPATSATSVKGFTTLY